MAENEKNTAVGIISLGCAKNLIDSERMLGALGAAGFVICAEPEDADVVIVNTCAFIEPARRESREAVRYALSLKRAGKVSAVVVAGCLPQRYREKILEECRGVDAIVGIHAFEEFPAIIASLVAKAGRSTRREGLTFGPPSEMRAETARLRLTPRHYAYLRVSEGCDNRCVYCVIPDVRGPLRSKPFEDVLAEAGELARDGAKELILVAQDTTSYGADLYGVTRLPELVRRVAAVDGLRWLRILYTHPAHYSDEFIAAFSDTPKLLPYLDIPVQHASDKILAKMGRGVTRRDVEVLIDRLREKIDGLVLRTSVLVGFPGETEEDFAELLDFIKTERFEKLGAFTYSREQGTPAALMHGHLSEAEKMARLEEVMNLQRGISLEKNRLLIGKKLEAVVDSISGDYASARTYRDAPDVDGVVHLKCRGKVEEGAFVTAEITDAGPYDLKAVLA